MKKIDEKDTGQEDEHGTGILSDGKVICPVCGKALKSQLPSKTSIFEDKLSFGEDTRIINSELTLECVFGHCRDEEEDEMYMENPHAVKVVIKAVLNGEGECTHFEITEIHPG